MTDLSDKVESLKRYVAPPGNFAALFPNATDDDLVGYLTDAFAESQLDGFFLPQSVMYGMPSGITYTLNVDAGTVTPDVDQAQLALITLYAALNITRQQLTNLKTRSAYKAGPVSFEQEQGSNVLTSLLKELSDRRDKIIQRLRTISASSAFEMADQYFIRAVGPWPYYLGEYADAAYDYQSLMGFPV